VQHICKDEAKEEETKVIGKTLWFVDEMRKLKPPKRAQQKDSLNYNMLHFLSPNCQLQLVDLCHLLEEGANKKFGNVEFLARSLYQYMKCTPTNNIRWASKIL
jgi:hypothetical protein